MATGLTLQQLQQMGAKPVTRIGGGLTLDQLQAQQAQAQKTPGVSFQSKPTDTALTSGLKTLGNIPSSTLGFGKSLVQFFNPINTVKTAQEIGTTLADSKGVTLGSFLKELPSATYNTLVPQFFTKLFKGDVEGAKKIITEDPVGQLAPVLLVMRGVAEKAGVGAKFDKVISETTKTVTKPITKTVTGVGNVVTNTLGVTTGAGGGAIKTALQGGKEFTDAMRGKTSMKDVLAESQDAVSRLAEMRRMEYQTKLADIKKMPQNLDISPVIKTLKENLRSFNVKPINGEITGKSFERSVLQNDKPAQGVFKTIYDNLKTYGTQPGDRTPIALDTLKRSLSDLYSDNSSVRSFTQSMTSSVNGILKKHVPKYEEMTKQYADYSNLLKEIKQNLAVGGKAAEGTAMTRLTNALKQNNELRLEVLKELEKVTGVNLKDKIAGAALSEAIPRGFIGKGIDIYALSSMFRGIFSPEVFAQILLTSPRFVGELMNALGIGARGAWKIIKPLNESPMIFFSPEKRQGLENTIKKTPLGLSIEDVSKKFKPEVKTFFKNEPTFNELGQLKEFLDSFDTKFTELPDGIKSKNELIGMTRQVLEKNGVDTAKMNTVELAQFTDNALSIANKKPGQSKTNQPTQNAKINAQNIPISKSIPQKTAVGQVENSLISEAKKYKSAEEFVNKQEPIYHGADPRNIDALNKNGVKILSPEEKLKLPSTGGGNYGISMTTDKATAQNYSQALGNKNIGEFYINPNAKVKTISGYIDDVYTPAELEKLAKNYDVIKSTAPEMEVRILTNNGAVTKSQLTDIWNKANKKVDPLIQEAKKYKSAEEFVNSKASYFTGGKQEISQFGELGKNKIGQDKQGVFLTSNNKYAKIFAGKDGKITQVFADIKKPFKVTDENMIEAPQNYAEYIQELKDKGYDSLLLKKQKFGLDNKGVHDQLLVLDPSVLKTKSQLTDIWKKANNK
jgi:hypothetical protein